MPVPSPVSHSGTALLFVLSGPSGVGKDSLLRRLQHAVKDVKYVVTATTRLPRPGEEDGRSYFFVSTKDYEDMLDRGELLAPAKVHGNWYGAPLEQIRQALAAGTDVLLKIDVQGAIQVRRRIPQAVFIFLAPESLDDLLERLRTRHTESPDELERRLRDARFEMEQMRQYDYCVMNREDDLDQAVGDVACIISAERLRTNRQPIDLAGR